MERVKVINLQIEDYYGTALDNLYFDEPIEIDPKEINLRVDGFSFVEKELEEGGYLIRVQFEHESLNGLEEMDVIHNQFMEFIIEGAEGFLSEEGEISEQLIACLEMLV
jgi:flagellar biosynthesis component FlhA